MASSSSVIVRSNDTTTPQYEEVIEYPPVDKLQAAARLGAIFYTDRRQDVLCSEVSLFTLFTQKLSAFLKIFNSSDPNFFHLTKSVFYSDVYAHTPRFITYFEHPKFLASDTNPIFKYQALSYIFSRCFAESIGEAPSQETDFSQFVPLLVLLRSYVSCVVGAELTANEEYVVDFLDRSNSVLLLNDPALLQNNLLDLGTVSLKTSKVQSYRSTIKNFIMVFSQMDHLLGYIQMDQSLSMSLPCYEKMQCILTEQMRTVYQAIIQNKTIPRRSKIELFFHLRRHCLRIFDNFKEIELMKGRMFAADSLKYYRDVLCSKKAQAIGLTRVESIGRNRSAEQDEIPFNYDVDDPIFPTYAEENREAYEFFIPRIREMVEHLSSARNQIKNDLLVIQEAPAFFRDAHVESLLSKLGASQGNKHRVDAAIFKEIQEFSQAALLQAIESGQDIPAGIHQEEFEQLEEIFCSASKVIEVFLSDKIQREKEWNAALFDRPYGSSSRKIRKLHSKISRSEPTLHPMLTPSSSNVHPPSHTMASSSSSTLEPPTLPSEASSLEIQVSESASLSPSSFTLELEQCRAILRAWLGNLSASRSPLTAEALKNSYEHIDNLFSSLRRACQLSQREYMTQNELFALVNDSVRHCTLGIEQLLSGLFRETNGIKTKEALAPHLTHDLFQLLQMCGMGKGDLSPNSRKWITEINRGEIIVRDLHLVSENDTVLHNLLRTNQRMMSPPTSPSSSSETSEKTKPLMEALFDYLSPLGELLETIQDRFPVKGPSSSVPLREPLLNLFETFYKQMSPVAIVYADPLSFEKTPVQLNEMRSLLLDKLPSDFNGTLDNILQNLLVHLETELQAQEHLEPIEASLHLGNILLLDQMIAEGVLLHAVHSKTLPLNLTEESDHDLYALVQKLQVEKLFSKEELDFLKSAKTSRQFIRYPASYSNSRSAKGPLSRLDKMLDLLTWGRTLANQQSPREELRGFTSENRESAKKLQEVKTFAANDVRLLSSIVKKVLSKP